MVMKHYPPEFKAEAVALYRSRPDATIAQIADDLGINRETLRSWIRIDDEKQVGHLARPAGAGAAPAGPAADAEVAALRKRIRELEEERDILRKAARYFAGETKW
jgi:transposase